MKTGCVHHRRPHRRRCCRTLQDTADGLSDGFPSGITVTQVGFFPALSPTGSVSPRGWLTIQRAPWIAVRRSNSSVLVACAHVAPSYVPSCSRKSNSRVINNQYWHRYILIVFLTARMYTSIATANTSLTVSDRQDRYLRITCGVSEFCLIGQADRSSELAIIRIDVFCGRTMVCIRMSSSCS